MGCEAGDGGKSHRNDNAVLLNGLNAHIVLGEKTHTHGLTHTQNGECIDQAFIRHLRTFPSETRAHMHSKVISVLVDVREVRNSVAQKHPLCCAIMGNPLGPSLS